MGDTENGSYTSVQLGRYIISEENAKARRQTARKMKRLCVYYRLADLWVGKQVDWIVCKECQKKIRKGVWLYSPISKP